MIRSIAAVSQFAATWQQFELKQKADEELKKAKEAALAAPPSRAPAHLSASYRENPNG